MTDLGLGISAQSRQERRGRHSAGRGTTGRTLLVADAPDAMFAQAVAAGATAASEMADEHGWRLGRIFDPFGHEWEIGRPLGPWPPA
jgi:PhnB protein